MDAGGPPPRDLTTIARACGAFAIALGAVILVGWLIGAGLLTQVVPSLPAAMPNSALMFVACGLALVLRADGSPCRRQLAAGCAGFVVAVATLTLLEHATGTALGVDNPLGLDFDEQRHPGRPATHTAGAFLLLGGCLLLRRAPLTPRRPGRRCPRRGRGGRDRYVVHAAAAG